MSALPHRTATTHSIATNSTSDDEGVVGEDTSETSRLLLERLQAWKHMCGYLEEYIDATAKIHKSQAKDYEKVLKTINNPLREGHHFDQGLQGVAGLFEVMRNNTRGTSNMYIELEKNLKGQVLPILERLHKEIKSKSKELKSGTTKVSKAVDKARSVTQKHIELLGQYAAAYSSAGHTKIEPQHDPYVLRRGINHRLNKQVIEENNSRNDTIAVQNSFAAFEAHVIETVQLALNTFFQFVGGQLDQQRALYGDIVQNAQNIAADYEWNLFVKRNDGILIDPEAPPRSFSNISFPNQDHASTRPLIEGTLERKSRALIKGYSTGYYVVTPARYLHEFKDNDDFTKDPTPELSLYLPDCIIGAIDGAKFHVKGKDVSNGKVGNAFSTTSEFQFKAHTPNDAEKWWRVIKDATSSPAAVEAVPPPINTNVGHSASTTATPVSATTTPAGSRNVSATHPVDKEVAVGSGTADAAPGVKRSPSHYHTSPGGTGV
ncbi:PH domain protein [Talaromyces stipitatus ATCC 10500]|uniref:PH domain protein n=1 Tax=Talaromyces stipitatus (strain ATCC 10500 / CBS 375.48 / QM 6759 / NRRL 1006) TaxID=441959 RepID=B8LY83_TALSN|nr:PH domain protein [Talaromyces stipitatus ATCC 10500]XP_002340716.1 PH domain protein [Talaromyces stipitatus ATCC 10500]EED23328.1 PH domain protein [Talaromyces stipitatus ATCC 10500]EED23329.1 PH domain protein [Talaromyces stipitatus ATCC 10500]